MNKKLKETLINIGTGKDYSIKDYAKLILRLVMPGQKIKIKYDLSKPSGTPKKVLDVSLAKSYGWVYKSTLKDSLYKTYQDFTKSKNIT